MTTKSGASRTRAFNWTGLDNNVSMGNYRPRKVRLPSQSQRAKLQTSVNIPIAVRRSLRTKKEELLRASWFQKRSQKAAETIVTSPKTSTLVTRTRPSLSTVFAGNEGVLSRRSLVSLSITSNEE